MARIIDLTYHTHTLWSDPEQVLQEHEPAIAFAPYLKSGIEFVKHLNFEGKLIKNNINYSFYKSGNSFWHIPLKTHRYIKKWAPDIILVQGFIYPLQVICLKFMIGKRIKIVIQHHGETPSGGIKRWFQALACKYASAFLFTSKENSQEWIHKKVIKPDSIIYELIEASTHFSYSSQKNSIKLDLGLSGQFNFLWVGRLNTNKDPLTVLKAFGLYIKKNPLANLYMAYQDDELLSHVKSFIAENGLTAHIHLLGYIPHSELEKWYNATDFYISASHKEACGYSILEAMACGCIPIVSSIPPFKKITDNGNYGLLFTPCNADSLLDQLRNIHNLDQMRFSETISAYFKNNLSFSKIASDLDSICNSLVGK